MKARLVFVVLAMVTVGCAASGDTPGVTTKKDSGHTDAISIDDGGSDEDAPPLEETGSIPIDDSGSPKDTGTAPDDTSIPPDDTSIPPDDTGTPPDDTGTTPTDTGSASAHVGEVCSTSGDCIGSTASPPTGFCSNEAFAAGPLDPTAVCVQINTCTPDSTKSVLCDGSRGICLDPGGTGTGECRPLCKFSASGTFTTTCAGKNVCSLEYFTGTGSTIAAFGQCFGGCTADSDCPSGSKCDAHDQACYQTCTTDTDCSSGWGTGAPATWKCDTTKGACTFKYPKAFGATCTASTDCPCLKSSTAASGTCTKSCITGSTASAISCGTGYTCDLELPAGFTSQPNGVSGLCLKNCTTATDCPTGMTCSASAGLTQKTCRP